jgi:hypothetical protein
MEELKEAELNAFFFLSFWSEHLMGGPTIASRDGILG